MREYHCFVFVYTESCVFVWICLCCLLHRWQNMRKIHRKQLPQWWNQSWGKHCDSESTRPQKGEIGAGVRVQCMYRSDGMTPLYSCTKQCLYKVQRESQIAAQAICLFREKWIAALSFALICHLDCGNKQNCRKLCISVRLIMRMGCERWLAMHFCTINLRYASIERVCATYSRYNNIFVAAPHTSLGALLRHISRK